MIRGINRHMKIGGFLLAIVFFSCGGSLSDEQRKQMREKMEENKIVRVTEVELMDAAYAIGREGIKKLDSIQGDSAMLEWLKKEYGADVRFIEPGESTARLLEQQLIDAYLSDPSGSFQDNVQEVRNGSGDFDTLLYTKPVTRKLPDGRDELRGIWNIWLPKKELVKEVARRR